MRRPLLLGGGIGLAVVVADQLAKSAALATLDDGPVHLVWTLRLRLAFNRGAAFGIGPSAGPWLVVLGVVVLVLLVAVGRRGPHNRASTVAMGLVVGGAVGNIVDRVVRDHGGAVVDFIDLRWWPVFNLADMAITCGALLLVLAAPRR